MVNNKYIKEQLIQEVKDLCYTENWKSASTRIKEIDAEYRVSGWCEKSINNSLFQEFKEAKNLFYQNKKSYFDTLNIEAENNATIKRGLINQMKYITGQYSYKKNLSEVKNLRSEFKAIGYAGNYNKEISNEFYYEVNDFYEKWKKESREFYRGEISRLEEVKGNMEQNIFNINSNTSNIWIHISNINPNSENAYEKRLEFESWIANNDSKISRLEEKKSNISDKIYNYRTKLENAY